MDLTIRAATAADAETVAAIHTASRRIAYRDVYSAIFLGEQIETETRASWRSRLANPDGLVVLMAEYGTKAVGFLAWVPDQHPVFGGLIDNFHIRPDEKGRGVGRQLFRAICVIASTQRPRQAVFLWVYESNVAARRAYASFGGAEGERVAKATPDGEKRVTAIRVTWAAPLIER